ncbi:MAG: hypothetical protein WKG00_00990 [Polyangiaceae bacterium]
MVATKRDGSSLESCSQKARAKARHAVPVLLGNDGRDDVQTLAARRLHERRQLDGLQRIAHALRRVDDSSPGQRLVRVDVDDHAVRVLEVGGGRAPGMHLEDADLRQADQAREVVDDQVVAGLGLLADGDASQRLGRPVPAMFLEEARARQAVGAAHQRRRAVDEVREHPVGDALVEWRCDAACFWMTKDRPRRRGALLPDGSGVREKSRFRWYSRRPMARRATLIDPTAREAGEAPRSLPTMSTLSGPTPFAMATSRAPHLLAARCPRRGGCPA